MASFTSANSGSLCWVATALALIFTRFALIGAKTGGKAAANAGANQAGGGAAFVSDVVVQKEDERF